MKALVGKSDVQVIAGHAANDEHFFICDDCSEAYLAPAYVTFDPEECKESVGQDIFTTPHENCTGNICPSCADFLEPDNEDDPRKQVLHLVDGMVVSDGVR